MIRLVLLSSLSFISSVQSGGVGHAEETRAMVYLMQYGYVEPQQWRSSLLTEPEYRGFISKAVREFQAFSNLNMTGELDTETMEMMERPRCGVEDIIGHGARAKRRKRYVLQGSKWQQSSLSWRVRKYPAESLLNKQDIDTTVTEAFHLWAEASGLQFWREDQQGKVDIEITFEEYEHGDGDPFDGPGGTLAHAYFPQFGGDIHIDSSESWTLRTVTGTNLLQTITHEIGHSLGLSHSDVGNSVMAPFYRNYDPDQPSLLTRDDVKAIQALYGPYIPKPTTQYPAKDDDSQLCRDTKIDAIFRTEDNSSYVFQGEQYWRLTIEAVAPGYPRPLSDWDLPGNIEAAFTWQKTGATYVFKGSQYWKFVNTVPAKGYPKSIREGFPGIPHHVDSAFVWRGNEKIYFTRGDKYWKFDPDRRPHVRSQYPKPISDWSLPTGLDGALQWQNGITYFFKSGQYWRFDDTNFSIAKSSPRYPRKTSKWWFGC